MAATSSFRSDSVSAEATASGTTAATAAEREEEGEGEKTECTDGTCPTETDSMKCKCTDGSEEKTLCDKKDSTPSCTTKFTMVEQSSKSFVNFVCKNENENDPEMDDDPPIWEEQDDEWEEEEGRGNEDMIEERVQVAESGLLSEKSDSCSGCRSNRNKISIGTSSDCNAGGNDLKVKNNNNKPNSSMSNDSNLDANRPAIEQDNNKTVVNNSNNCSSSSGNASNNHSWRKRKQCDSPHEFRNGLPCKKLFSEDKTVLISLKKKLSECVDKDKVRIARSVIPSKDNPPPEITDWLLQFQRWSNAERLLAIDRLIEMCEPTQVRHMMQLIEPQFQRDFISLLPKELALHVLSFLEPRDLLRAAQTCRSWRFLAEDNLLWREKCREAGVDRDATTKRSRHRPPTSNSPSSPWKAAFMRHHTIEMNWRVRPIRPPKVLKGHDDHVITCLQFSGNRIVSGSDDNTLKVWSATTGKCLRTLVGHTGGVWSSQMAGSVIISGSTDRTLKVWNAESGQCLHTLYGHTSTVRCMHLHGKKVVSGSRDATLRVWHIESGECLHVLVGHLAAVRCVQYDGRLVVSGAYDYMVKVWNPEREECLHTLQGHTNRVYSLQFDGVHVVSGSLDTSIRVWEVETGACRHTLMGHQSLTSGMELRNNILVSGNADSTVKVWDILTGQCLQTLSGPNKHQSAVTCLQFNNRFVITSSDDGTVKLWDVKTGDFIRNLVALESGGSGGVVWRIRANETKLVCAVGSRNGTEETKLLVLDFDVEVK